MFTMMSRRNNIRVLLLIALLGSTFGYDENDDMARKAGCGHLELPVPKPSDPAKDGSVDLGTSAYLVRVFTVDDSDAPVKDTYAATGSYVSPIHIITSAQAILSKDQKWLLDDTAITLNCDAETHMPVPDEYVKKLRVGIGSCATTAACETSERRVKQAYLLNMCDTTSADLDFDIMYRAMILEMDATAELNGWPCIADVPVDINIGDKVRMYGYEFQPNVFTDPVMSYRHAKITKDTKIYWMVDKYYSPGNRGGPMLGFYQKRWFLLGVGASPGLDDSAGETYFFKTKIFTDAICSHFKICGRKLMSEVLPPKPTTTSAPDTTTIKIHTDPPTTLPTTIQTTQFAMPQAATNPPIVVTVAPAPTVAPTQRPVTTTEKVVESTKEPDEYEELSEFSGAQGYVVWSSVLFPAMICWMVL